MPIRIPGYRMPRPDQRAWLDRAPGTRRARDPSALRPERRPALLGRRRFAGDLLYDRDEADATGEVRNQAGGPSDKEMTDLLVEAMRSIDAPAEQLIRLGLG